jgi:glycerophosphoryl diester phosphodiesterase
MDCWKRKSDLRENEMFSLKRSCYKIKFLLILLGILIGGEMGCATKKELVLLPWKGKFPVMVIAHRGFSGHAPENTLISFKKAIELGSDMIELDIHLSKDREVVVIHDDTLDRTTDGRGKVVDFTVKELKKLDAGSRFGSQYAGERIPTLKEVLELSKGKIPVNIEIKNPKNGKYPVTELAEKSLKEVKEAGMLNQVNFFSFNPIALGRIKEKAPKAWVTLLYHESWNFIREITRGEAFPVLGLRHIYLTKEKISKIRHEGMKVFVYTVDSPEEMEKFITWGVNGIITNYPDRLIKILQERGTQ